MVDSFNDFLTEKHMTIQGAEKVLGLDGSYNAVDVKKARNIAIKTAHPDKGGSLEQSKLVNIAYDLLKGRSSDSGSSNSRFEREEVNRKYASVGQFVNADLMGKFAPDAFLKYFEGYFGMKFNHTITMRDATNIRYTQYYAGFKSKFATDDNKIVFEFDVNVYLTDVVYKNTKTLSNDENISYVLSITAYGYANRKKQKMSQRDWKQMSNHSVLWDASKSFSPAKMKKIASASGDVKMKRADFQLAMKNEVKALDWNDAMMIPLKDGKYLQVYRIVFMRLPMWQLGSIGTIKGHRFVDTELVSGSLPENETTLDLFLSLKNMNEAQARNVIEKAYKKYIGK